jgi:indole-3-glycerol phosphate synthase
VAESGYQDAAAIQEAVRAGADAVLVGERLLKCASVEAAFRELFGARGDRARGAGT